MYPHGIHGDLTLGNVPGRWMPTHKGPAALRGCPGNPQRWPSCRDATAWKSRNLWETRKYLGSHTERNTQRPTVTKLAPGPEPRSQQSPYHKIAVHKYSPWDHHKSGVLFWNILEQPIFRFHAPGTSVSVVARRWQLVWMVCLESFPFPNRQSHVRLTRGTKLRGVAERTPFTCTSPCFYHQILLLRHLSSWRHQP